MKHICAWCKKDLSGTTPISPATDEPISHGICRDCGDHFRAQAGMPLREFLDQIRAPVAVVDAQGIIRAVNKAGRTLVGKTSAQTDGLPGGNIFECEYSHLPEGCGKTAHCSGCAIRNTVMDTHRSGRSHSHVTANLRQRQTAGTQDLRLQISTEKVNEVVLLRVDEIKPK